MAGMQSLVRAIAQRKRFSSNASRQAFLRGQRLMRDAQWSVAAEAYGVAVKGAPKWAALWVQYGHALKESGSRAEAEKAYLEALSLEPEKADTYLQLGHVRKLLGRADEAVIAYLTAAELDPAGHEALREIEELAKRGAALPTDRLLAIASTPWEAAISGPDPRKPEDDFLRSAGVVLEKLIEEDIPDKSEIGALLRLASKIKSNQNLSQEKENKVISEIQSVVFDVADLISYFRNARLPTGIQRVQIEVVSGFLASRDDSISVSVCSFSEHHDDWVEIPPGLFLHVCRLSLASGDVLATDWLLAMRRLELIILTSKPIDFSEQASLVNLGTSWWLQNYFLNVRNAKARHNINYVPFVHDLIPVMTPQHCVKELTQDFISWIQGVFQHADMFLANSEATKRDLLSVAASLGHEVSPDDVEVVRLDADFRREMGGDSTKELRKWGVKPDRYVLFVSTIEARKNHMGAFNAWLWLMRKHGARKVPKLVCVGNSGWLNDEVHAKLASSDALRTKVKMLSKLSDGELSALYKHSLFTLYPSHYEGWGLPVTESFCYGKPALISDSSSLPEAGGIFADYFQAGSDVDLALSAEKLIFDAEYRARRKRLISEKFKPRPWANVGDQIAAAVAKLRRGADSQESPKSLRAAGPMGAQLGVYYPMMRNLELEIWPGMASGEIYRAGAGWWWPDDWGVWTKPEGGDIALRLSGPHEAVRLFFKFRGVVNTACKWTLDFTAPDPTKRLSGRIGPDELRWAMLDLPASEDGTLIFGRLSADHSQSLAEATNGADTRIASIGLCGFYICEISDLPGRLALAEAIACDDLAGLSPGAANRQH